MADFNTALSRTLPFEGGYSRDPNDPGGETYKGIARSRQGAWSGWALVDAKRSGPGFPLSLDQDADLRAEVDAFYRRQWNQLMGDDLTDQALANELFDCAVNMGNRRAVSFLQRALNVLNAGPHGPLYAKVTVDGAFGEHCLGAVTLLLKRDQESAPLLKVLGILRGQAYVSLMEAKPQLMVYARGWLKRVWSS
jgi:lysozyme family protein